MRLERVISLTLRTGVIFSTILVVTGLVLYYVENGPSFLPTYEVGILTLFAGLVSLRPEAFILLGVVVLIFTPVARVLELLVEYIWLRDRIYVVLSAMVLSVMLFAILLLPSIR